MAANDIMLTPDKVSVTAGSVSPITNLVSPTLSLSSSPPSPSSEPLTSPSRKSKKKSVKTSRLEKIVFIFIGVFLLNSINGRLIMKSVRSQYESFQDTYLLSTPQILEDLPKVENKTEDTAIIITSSPIPSHPSTYMVDQVVKSVDRLIGLSPSAPIFITVDHFRFTDFANLPPSLKNQIEKLEQYTINLYNQYLTNPRIHIIPGMTQNHIGGSVMKAMKMIEIHYPMVKYLYYLQHDFLFARDIDHTALVNAFEANAKVNFVRFPKRAPHTLHPGCGNEPKVFVNRTVPIDRNGVLQKQEDDEADNNINATDTEEGTAYAPHGQISLSPTAHYSDNNHMTRFKWYKETIASLIKITRAPENPLMVRGGTGCATGKPMGLYIYNEWDCIAHLDGRQNANVPK